MPNAVSPRISLCFPSPRLVFGRRRPFSANRPTPAPRFCAGLTHLPQPGRRAYSSHTKPRRSKLQTSLVKSRSAASSYFSRFPRGSPAARSPFPPRASSDPAPDAVSSMDSSPDATPALTPPPAQALAPPLLFRPSVSLVLHLTLTGLTVWTFFNRSLFGFHPTLMALAYLLFMPEGILQAVRGSGKLRKAALTQHMLLGASAGVAAVGGLVTIYLNKERLGKPHLMTLHARLGALAFVASSLVASGGVPMIYGFPALLKRGQLPKLINKVHKQAGFLTCAMGSFVCILGLKTFNRQHPLHKGLLTYFLAALCAASTLLLLASIQRKKALKKAVKV